MNPQELDQYLNAKNTLQLNKAFRYLDNKLKVPFQRWSYLWYWRKSITNEDIADVYQETMIVFYNWVLRNGTSKIKVKIKTFIFGIAKKKWKEHFRKKVLWNKMADIPEFVTHIWTHDADREAKLARIEAYFNELSGSCKEILTLTYFFDLSCKEIGKEIPNLSIVNCRQKRFSCIQKMRERLGAKKAEL